MTPSPSAAPRLDPDASCGTCGAHGAFLFDGAALCADCYSNQGSSCAPNHPGSPPTENQPPQVKVTGH